MTEFEKVTKELIEWSVGKGFYPIEMIMEISTASLSDDTWKIYNSWTENEEAAFLIYFGSECMKRLKRMEEN
ncbi:hypothetical protein [Levilactobacillus sp. N40-8-2]|uniref:hypothetical protein n=1 Tax=Levilactobacillus muriae TaxID=3238987 RepID=UPI0038B3C1F9